MLPRYNVDSETYNRLLHDCSKWLRECDDLRPYFVRGYTDNKRLVRFNPHNNTLIIQAYRVQTLENEPDWKQVVCVLDRSLDGVSDIQKVPWACDVDRKVYSILRKHYSDEELGELFLKHSWEKNESPLHKLLPYDCLDGHVHKFTNCVYYDINRAHADALCEIFPKARKQILALDKLYINIFVGDLCNQGHRPTFNWIVKRTKELLLDVINKANGLCIYINTDGVIIHNPTTLLPTSNEIGDIKSESVDGVVYGYHCKRSDDATQYTLYQYVHPTKGVQKKGNARLSIRKNIDLSQGLIAKGKIVQEGNEEVIKNFRIERVPIDEE